MKLYMRAAACSLSPHIVCRELGIDVELIAVDPANHRAENGNDYLSINGNGYVPALILDDGKVLTEGPVIAQFLAETAPEGTSMLPAAGTFERSQVQSYLNFISSELHKPMVMFFDAAYGGAHESIHALILKRLEWLNKRMKGAYLTGENFTVADAYLFVCLNWSPWIAIDLRQWPALSAFMKRVGERPRVREALRAEQLLAFEQDGVFFAPEVYLAAANRTGTPVLP